ncbi:MAG: bifunctional pyr operon transcriptional regulator/uracil phosphoribosyltransferase PyrR [Chloroflexi bacterium]|nr:bifunctional pyr operon transcriptional regulator/uracil phosphoribosyltransferase PyrR [Chloroflexota bacterium]MYB84505.1 bifunctional pyr operon transcriptional regulator/uracil phosphoribosyltransferase PyrR [Chloroflexota bacterium]MYF65368.1 bifunctional pyr operon transcriptional regulator/uracil phosphoribosyltransferase PyrR [Chloroflexota bacterium]MYK35880.1 bifunctional pyr operon transcriptional regulator/uracil phosphoribosyltransferase PyrR [Chloroflexota bacterium]
MAEGRLILTGEEMRRALTRIAHEVVESNKGLDGLILVGIRRRGVPLARRIADAVASFEDASVPVGALDINLYRDDLTSRPQPLVRPTELPSGIEGKAVVLVDDVLFTGRTIRAALNALMDLGRPRIVQLAVLVDRGHHEFPIRADYVGKNVPTSLNEIVEVRVAEIDGVEEVALVERVKAVSA